MDMVDISSSDHNSTFQVTAKTGIGALHNFDYVAHIVLGTVTCQPLLVHKTGQAHTYTSVIFDLQIAVHFSQYE